MWRQSGPATLKIDADCLRGLTPGGRRFHSKDEMTGDEWLAAFVRDYGAERAARELARLAESLRLGSLPTDDDFGLVPWTDEDDAAMQFKPGELDLLLVPADDLDLTPLTEADLDAMTFAPGELENALMPFTDDDFAALFRSIDEKGTE